MATTLLATPQLEQQDTPEINRIIAQSGLAEFARDIRLGKFERSYDVAKRTVVILNKTVRDNNWSTERELIKALKAICAYIDGLGLVETAAGNMTRRILRIVRDECQNYNAQLRAHQLSDPSEGPADSSRDINRDVNESSDTNLDLNDSIKENILEAIEQELMNELELSSRTIAEQSIYYVQSDEIILTLGKSKVIESFLKYAATGDKSSKRKITVIVVELAPFYSGREMAKLLNKSGISTLIIPDSAVFAIMSRVNKVIIGTHSMMANGGIKAPAGSHSIALAAKHFSVPLIVCCPMYKLTPGYLVSHDSAAFEHFSNLHSAFPEPYTPVKKATSPMSQVADNDADSSDEVELEAKTQRGATGSMSSEPLQRRQGDEATASSKSSSSVEALLSTFDYVPPELITLFVSNIGGNSPSYVYQLLNELYSKCDYLN